MSNVAPLFSPELRETNVYTQTLLEGTVKTLPIAWTTQGEYLAYIYLIFKNGSNPITYKLQDFKIVVQGIDVVKQDSYNRKTLVATVDGALLSIINISTAIELVRISGKAKREKDIGSKYSGGKMKHYREIHKKKKISRKKS